MSDLTGSFRGCYTIILVTTYPMFFLTIHATVQNNFAPRAFFETVLFLFALELKLHDIYQTIDENRTIHVHHIVSQIFSIKKL